MLKCLQCIHNLGLIHGDVKIDNFLVWENPLTIKINDFANTLSATRVSFSSI